VVLILTFIKVLWWKVGVHLECLVPNNRERNKGETYVKQQVMNISKETLKEAFKGFGGTVHVGSTPLKFPI